MMKKTLKLLVKSFVAMAFAASIMTSCNQFDEIWDKIDSIEAQLDSIKNDLNSQVSALSTLMSDGSTISSCNKNDDGSYVVTLSDGKSFTVLPDGTDASALVSITEVGGVMCWALVGPDGELTPLEASGKIIPVSTAIDVEVKDGKYVLVVNGKEYETGYDTEDIVSVFSSCVPHADASGQVYAMTFTFGNGLEVTVAVDGYKGVILKLANAGMSSVVTEYFVDYKQTQSFLMETEGVIDYVMQIPDGWRVEENYNELTSETYLDITAPASETIAAGAAVAEGDLKVVSVVEGGKAAVTKLSLSTDPFKTYNVSAVKAVIEPYNGIQKFAYGMMTLSAFDESQLIGKVNELLSSSGDLPSGYYISENGIDNTLSEIYGADLSSEGEYVFWVLPVLYSEGEDGIGGGFYVVEDMLRTKVLAPISAKVEISSVSVIDADLKIEVKGTLAVYAGISVKSDDLFESIAYQINNKALESSDVLTYDGPASEFPTQEDALELEPDTEYVVWVVPVDDEKTSYEASDVIYKEFKTMNVMPGGTLSLTMGTVTADCSSLNIPLTSTGASMIYYAFLNDTEGKRIEATDNETKMNKIQSAATFTKVKGATANAVVDFIKPETTMWLFAAAIGADGKYGDVICQSATTEPVTFNSLSVSVTDPVVTVDDATFTISVSGGTATDYIYWCGKETDPFWLYEEYCGKTRQGAEVYMAANPDAEAVREVMRKNGSVSSDGKLVISGLDINSTYMFVILAKDESGLYSKATTKKFNTPAADLGDLVTEGSDKWNTTKKWIEDNIIWYEDQFEPASGMMYASYALDMKIPTDLTAYIYCFGTLATNTVDVILEVERECTSKLSKSKVVYDENGEQPVHPDYYDDNGKLVQGSLVNVYNMYSHGSADNGCVTFFSANGHSAMHCTAWLSGVCANYEEQMQTIEKFMSYEYWEERIIDEGNYHYNNDPNHEYSRTLTDPEKIATIAKQYQEIYTKYYQGVKPILYVNNGDPIRLVQREGFGLDDKGNVVDKILVVLKDESNNYYEPMYIDVPNYFK